MDKEPKVVPFESKSDLERKSRIVAKLQQIAQAALNVRLQNPSVDGTTQGSLMMVQDKATQMCDQMKRAPLSSMQEDLSRFNLDLINADLRNYLEIPPEDPLGLLPEDSGEGLVFKPLDA